MQLNKKLLGLMVGGTLIVCSLCRVLAAPSK